VGQGAPWVAVALCLIMAVSSWAVRLGFRISGSKRNLAFLCKICAAENLPMGCHKQKDRPKAVSL
jgi:hypothetical protein